ACPRSESLGCSAFAAPARPNSPEPLVTNALSRLLVAAAAIPVVLGAVYLGGWWLFALAVAGAVVALHEYWRLTRRLSPLSPAGYVGAVLALVGAQLGGITWMLGGVLAAFPLAFALK